jgi:hypothetical protein
VIVAFPGIAAAFGYGALILHDPLAAETQIIEANLLAVPRSGYARLAN